MKMILLSVIILTAVCGLLNGCGNQTDTAAFDSAKPEIKSVWLQSLAAIKANDYVSANTNLMLLLRLEITSSQQAAVLDALSASNRRMNNAAVRGDANARKALEALNEMQQSRRRPSAGSPHSASQ